MLATYAAQYESGEWVCYPKVEELRDRTGLGQNTIGPAFARLEDAGLIKRLVRRHNDGTYLTSWTTLRVGKSLNGDMDSQLIARTKSLNGVCDS